MRFLRFASRLQLHVGAGLVDDVDGLVRQVPVVDVLGRQLRGRPQGRIGVGNLVVLFEALLQSLQDLDGLLHRRLLHVDLLEATGQRPVLLEDAAELLIGGGADAAQVAGGQHRLDQVGRIHDATGRRAGADDGVDLVDEQDRMGLALELREHRLEPLLEIAAILRARHQRAQIERVDHGVREHVRHLAVDDLLGQTLGNGRLADAGLADQQRVVLAPTTQDLRGALHLAGATDQRIDPALTGDLVEVGGEVVERAGGLLLLGARLFGLSVRVVALLLTRHLGDAVRDVVDHVQARHILLVQQEHRLAILLAEQGNQHVGAGDLLLSGGLYVEHRPLQHPLEAERRLRLAGITLGDQRRRFLDEGDDVLAQFRIIAAAGAQHLGGGWIVEQAQQQVLDRHVLVPLLPRLLEGVIQGEFELFA